MWPKSNGNKWEAGQKTVCQLLTTDLLPKDARGILNIASIDKPLMPRARTPRRRTLRMPHHANNM
jgi:hypothetical protein